MLHVLADVGDGQQAIEAVQRHVPHVVLMDVTMPVMDGITAMRALKRDHPGVVIFTGYADDRVAAEATEAGADAFVDKSPPLPPVADLLVEVGGIRVTPGAVSGQPAPAFGSRRRNGA